MPTRRPCWLAVDDTAANIEAGLSTLVADTGEIASITASKGRVAVSVATFLADQSTLDKIVGGFTISDTASDVAQNLDALSNDTNVTSIALTGGAVPTLSISLEEALNDTRGLDAITTPHMTVIADSAPQTISNIQAIYLSGENIAVASDGAQVIATGTVATMAILAQIETSLLESQGYTLAVLDTAANIRALTNAQINNLSLRGVLLIELSDTSVALSAKLANSRSRGYLGDGAGGPERHAEVRQGKHRQSVDDDYRRPARARRNQHRFDERSSRISVAQALALEDADLRIKGPKGHHVTVTVSDTAAHLEANGKPDRRLDGDRRHRACVDQCECQLHISPDRGDPQE